MSIDAFSQLDSGNYWVYERRRYDSTGVLTIGPYIDSIYFDGDTLWQGNSFKVQRRWTLGAMGPNMTRFIRDSADCIVEAGGRVLFRYGVFDEVAYSDTYYVTFTIDWSMPSATTTQTVPAGTFTCHTWQGYIHDAVQGSLWEYVPAERQPYYRWADGVGKVGQLEPFVNGDTEVLELARYHVQ